MQSVYILMAVFGGLWGAGAAVIALHSAGLVAGHAEISEAPAAGNPD